MAIDAAACIDLVNQPLLQRRTKVSFKLHQLQLVYPATRDP